MVQHILSIQSTFLCLDGVFGARFWQQGSMHKVPGPSVTLMRGTPQKQSTLWERSAFQESNGFAVDVFSENTSVCDQSQTSLVFLAVVIYSISSRARPWHFSVVCWFRLQCCCTMAFFFLYKMSPQMSALPLTFQSQVDCCQAIGHGCCTPFYFRQKRWDEGLVWWEKQMWYFFICFTHDTNKSWHVLAYVNPGATNL